MRRKKMVVIKIEIYCFFIKNFNLQNEIGKIKWLKRQNIKTLNKNYIIIHKIENCQKYNL